LGVREVKSKERRKDSESRQQPKKIKTNQPKVGLKRRRMQRGKKCKQECFKKIENEEGSGKQTKKPSGSCWKKTSINFRWKKKGVATRTKEPSRKKKKIQG